MTFTWEQATILYIQLKFKLLKLLADLPVANELMCMCSIIQNGRWDLAIHDGHDDVMKWKRFPRYWPFVRGIHRSPVNSPHKGQWRGALMFSLICVWINGWVNNGEAGDVRPHRAHCDVIVMMMKFSFRKHTFSSTNRSAIQPADCIMTYNPK